MQRHPYLQPLSREHHLGLVISTKAKTATNADMMTHWQALSDYLTTQIPTHFHNEDVQLSAVLAQKITTLTDDTQRQKVQDAIARLCDEHEQMRALITTKTPTLDDVRQLAHSLYEHIRFEERVLFPLAEQLLSTDELFAIYQASDERVKKSDQGR